LPWVEVGIKGREGDKVSIRRTHIRLSASLSKYVGDMARFFVDTENRLLGIKPSKDIGFKLIDKRDTGAKYFSGKWVRSYIPNIKYGTYDAWWDEDQQMIIVEYEVEDG